MKGKVKRMAMGWVNQYKNNVFLKRLSTVLIVDILVRASGIVLLPVYLRLMTQEEYGIYNYILSIITTFSVLLNFGLYVSQSKYYSDAQTEDRKKIVLFNIFFSLTSLLIVVITPIYVFNQDQALIGFLFKNDINYPLYRWPILLALIVSAYTVILSNFFIISERIDNFRRYNIFRLVLVHVVVLSSLYFSKGDKINVRILYTYITETAIMGIVFSLYFRHMLPKVDWKLIRNSLKLGLPVMFSAILAMFSNNGDKFFLEKYGTHKDLSCYYLAFSLSNIIIMIATSVQNIWMPMFLKEKDLKKNIVNTRKLIRKQTVILTIISILLVVAFYIALQMKVISSNYALTTYILPVLLLAQIINAALIIYVNYFIYLEKTHWSLLIGLATSTAGLLGSYYLIALWNVFGAAIVYLGVQLAYCGLYYLVINRNLKARMSLELNTQE